MKISDYPLLDTLDEENEFVVETSDGTKKLTYETLKTTIQTLIESNKDGNYGDILNKVYPIGSIYLSLEDVSPAELFGGSWVQLTDCFLRAGSDTGTGGSDTTSLTTANLAAHGHSSQNPYRYMAWSRNNRSQNIIFYPTNQSSAITSTRIQASNNTSTYNDATLFSSASDTLASWTANTGSGSPFSIMPAYQNVYAWRRID